MGNRFNKILIGGFVALGSFGLYVGHHKDLELKEAYRGKTKLGDTTYTLYEYPEREVWDSGRLFGGYQLIDEGKDGTLDIVRAPIPVMCGPRGIVVTKERKIQEKDREKFRKLQKLRNSLEQRAE